MKDEGLRANRFRAGERRIRRLIDGRLSWRRFDEIVARARQIRSKEC